MQTRYVRHLRAARRLLQAVVALLSLIPIAAGGAGIMLGPRFLGQAAVSADMDSHFRYLSGLLLALGLMFGSTVPAIERQSSRFRLVSALVVCGGLGRLWSWRTTGVPSFGHMAALVIELGIVPLLVLWQSLVAADWLRLSCREPEPERQPTSTPTTIKHNMHISAT